MMKGKVEPSEVPIVIHASKQIVEVLQMTSPHEKQLREQKQEVPKMTFPQDKQLREQRHEVKREDDTRFAEGEEHLHFGEDVYEDWMETITSP